MPDRRLNDVFAIESTTCCAKVKYQCPSPVVACMVVMIAFSETQYVRIDGSAVALEISSDEEAKLALKELRHKKREYQLLKRKLNAAIKNAPKPKQKRGKAKSHPAYESPIAFVGHSLFEVGALLQGLIASEEGDAKPLSQEQLVAQLAVVEETILHLDEAILHIQGRF